MAKKDNWKVWTAARRRRNWKVRCATCEFDWHHQKRNYVFDKGYCLYCYQYVNYWVQEGTTRIMERLRQVQKLERRLNSTGVGSRKKLKLVAGGRR